MPDTIYPPPRFPGDACHGYSGFAGPHLLSRLVVGVCAGAVAIASFTMVTGVALAKCDGDGGLPNSAADSPAGRFCEGPLVWPWAAALLVAPMVVLLGIGVVGIVRRRRLWVWVAPVVGVGTLLLLCLPVLALDQSCSAADQRAYDEWDGARGGEQPADCEQI
ncbi:MAG: hypothetical protein ACR2ML_04650 [Solirubrobacteraceae bacterium]